MHPVGAGTLLRRCFNCGAVVLLRLAATIAAMLWAMPIFAYEDGSITGYFGTSGAAVSAGSAGNCTTCHSGGSFSYTPTFTIASYILVSSSGNSVTFSLTKSSGASAVNAGLDVHVTNGTLVAGADTQVNSGEITHNTFYVGTDINGVPDHSKPTTGGNVSWSFNYTASATAGTYTLFGCGNLVNHNLASTGDNPVCTSQSFQVVHAPTGAADSYANVTENTAYSGSSVLSNDTQPDGPVTATLIGSPSHSSSFTLNSDGTFSYTPTNTYFGSDSFTYQACYGTVCSSTTTVSLTINQVSPTAVSDSYTVTENTPYSGSSVLANDTDPSGTPTASLIGSPSHSSSFTLNSDGTFSYTPTNAYFGSDSFTYQACHGVGHCSSTTTVSLTISQVSPTAVVDSYTVTENTPYSGSSVLANDTDPSGTPTASLIGSPSHSSSFTLNSDGTFSYTPTNTYFGSDSFTYQACHGVGHCSSTTTVSLTISQVSPTAVADSYTVTENTLYSGSSVLANDTDPSGTPTASLIGSPSHSSSFTLNSNGTFSYTPTNAYFGSDSFTYQACHGVGHCSSTTTVSLTISQVSPTAVADSYTVTENTPYSGSSVLSNDTDPSGTPTASLIGSPSHSSSFTLNSDGTFSYTPTNAYFGSDSFTYQACHGVGHCSSTTTVSLTINQVSPTAVADSYTVTENTPYSGSSVLANDTDPSGTPTASLIGSPSHSSSFTLNSDGTFSYTPTNAYFGSDSFTYQACHGASCSSTTTVSLTINQVAPTAVADSYANVTENTAYSGSSVLSNDTDPSGTPTASLIGSPSHSSSFTLNGNGTFSYTPTTHYFGSDSFTYQACHGAACSSTTTVSLTVNQVAPTATADSYSTAQNTTLTVPAGTGVLANDSDPSGLALTASVISTTSHGALTLNSDGSFTYIPAASYHGGDSFTYSASDGTLSASTTVSIAVGQSPPVANADSYSVNENTTLTVAAGSGVLANDTDPSSLSLTAIVGTLPSHGSLTLNSDGSFTYTPTNAFHGADSFTYQASDGSLTSSVATVTITVAQQPPVATADSYSVNQNTTLTVAVGSGVLNNDSDPSNLALTASVVSTTGHGTLTLNSNGSFTYTPTNAFHGTDTFTYTASDGTLTSTAATVTITVNQVAPTATADSYSVNENATLTVAVGSGVLNNDSDPSNLALTASVVSTTGHGTLTLNSNGSFTYTPTNAFHGTDTFTYTASDGTLTSTAATVTITVNQVAPTATADSYSVNENATLTVAVGSGVLNNDSDPSNLALTASVVSTTGHGTLTLNSNGSFTYTPTNAFHGTDTFTYTASDGTLTSTAATVTITVNQQPPVATGDSYSLNENATLTVPVGSGVLSNDTDPSNLALTASVVTTTGHGTLTLNSNGSFTYTPTNAYSGIDTFTYRASDGTLSATATVTLTVVQGSPVANADSYSVNENSTLTAAIGSDVLVNDTDPSNLALTASVVSSPSHGALTLNSDGTFTYTPTAGYFGADSFTYRAYDGTLFSNTATVTITVTQLAPTAVADSYSVNENATLTVAAAGVLSNDTDPSNLALTASVVVTTGHGTLTLNSNGGFTYTPTVGYFGTDTFTYTASDGTKTSNTATVTIAVGQQPPVATDDSYSDNQSVTLNVPAPGVLANDTDPSSLALNASVVTTVSHGTLTLNSDGSFSYTPAAGFYGADSFSYKVSDGNLNSNTATVAISVANVPVVTAPANITINAIGYLTYVDLKSTTATAVDSKDGALLVTADHASGNYRPGHYVVTYSATNSSSITTTATQTVDVIPLIDFGPDQTTGAGQTINVNVTLNGSAAAYPVTVAYTVGGTATAADSNAASGTATIASGTSVSIPITINPDSGNNPDRTIVLTLASPVNAVLDAQRSTTVTIVDHNVAPTVTLAASQQTQARTNVFGDEGPVTVTASATDPNAGDTVSYDWSGTDATLNPPTTSTPSFTFDPATVTVGSHTVKVTATDNHGASTSRTLTLLAQSTAPTGQDFTDTDGNGIPAYIDPYTDPSALPNETGNPSLTVPLETDAGLSLRLGTTALEADQNGALISASKITGSNATDTAVNVGGLFNFEVSGLTPGGTAQIVLPLQTALRDGAVYREYTGSGWQNFVSDSSNSVASAFAVNGVCPGPNSTSWAPGLNPFAQCVRLTVQDGGPNDADGVANGVIDNLGGAAVAALNTDTTSSSSSGGSGGAIAPALLAFLAAAAGLRRRHRSAGDSRKCH